MESAYCCSTRSVPGTAFTSSQFEEVLESERVFHKLGVSAGAHYSHGGVDRDIQEMVPRTTLVSADALHVQRELHPYAIHSYVDVFCKWTVEDGKPPEHEAFTGKRSNLIHRPLFCWRQLLFVFIPMPCRDLQFGARLFLAVDVSLEELEAYLALPDPNQLPFAKVDADDDEAGAVGVTFEEVQAERSMF